MRTAMVGCLVVAGLAFSAGGGRAAEKELKAGIIGLDTSHVIAFSKVLNDPRSPPELSGVRIVDSRAEG